ncbi:Protein of unknown function (DUF1279) [Seminavis robusta]|uniref:DUF1279 domain-containing protein n=1 Tax=Seminavis robusta TaxID=568900 RepID=A0A9N8EGN5_9STRA|nr:Protein of unknown function (DUF1279) [Seminavis robusta]|eukprot:Sro1171_g248860.1 Protein of unknown function (DUF1279) (294) ;mRNA; f:17061-17942
MLSSQQRLALRVARRRLPSAEALLYRQQQPGSNSLATFASSHWLHTSSSSWNRDDEENKKKSSRAARQLQGLPLYNRQWFSTTSSEDDNKKTDTATTYGERAAEYRERASEYSDKAKDGAKSFGGMMKAYGPTFLGTYLSVYAVTLGGLYVGVESGVLDPVTLLGYITGNHDDARSTAEVVAELLKHYTLTERWADTVQQKPHWANFAVAWVSTKFTEPIRFGATVAIVPRVARYFGVVVPSNNDNKEHDDTAANEEGEILKESVGDNAEGAVSVEEGQEQKLDTASQEKKQP